MTTPGDLAAMEIPAPSRQTPHGRSDVQKRLLLDALVICFTSIAQPKFTVRVYDLAHVREPVLTHALEAGREVFRQAGVESAWVTTPSQSCETATFTVRIMRGRSRMPGAPDAWGVAWLTKNGDPPNRADVYFGDVREHAITESESAWLLANVMAHEVGHLLLGGQHSMAGLMNGHWSKEDTRRAMVIPLRFERNETARLLQAVARLSCPESH